MAQGAGFRRVDLRGERAFASLGGHIYTTKERATEGDEKLANNTAAYLFLRDFFNGKLMEVS